MDVRTRGHSPVWCELRRSGGPGIDHFDAAGLEVPDIAGGQRSLARGNDAGDLNMADLDRPPGAAQCSTPVCSLTRKLSLLK
jgi:hypothetical protein